MSDAPGADAEEEPQEQRGLKGSRDTGTNKPSGGPVDRPEGTSDEESDTGIHPDKSDDPDAPDLQSGG